MTALLLRLAGPLQAWGDDSRFTRRDTRIAPTKSGVLGLLAAAQGRRRTDPIDDLTALRFGVRVDQPGRLLRDFQVARSADGRDSMPLSARYYLSDAAFVAGVEGPEVLIGALAEVVERPAFPLYLGRRSCPVTGQLSLGRSDEPLETAIRKHPWIAADWYRRRQPRGVELDVFVDALPNDQDPVETRRDVPLSFAPTLREYGWREVAHRPPVLMANPAGWDPPTAGVDWLTEVEQV